MDNKNWTDIQRMWMNKRLPQKLTQIEENIPKPMNRAWVSRKYLVQEYIEENNIIRLSICRVRRNGRGGWDDKITWDELQAIKSELGYEDWYGVEIYPPDKKVVNVANFRHLWLMEIPLDIGWI